MSSGHAAHRHRRQQSIVADLDPSTGDSETLPASRHAGVTVRACVIIHAVHSLTSAQQVGPVR